MKRIQLIIIASMATAAWTTYAIAAQDGQVPTNSQTSTTSSAVSALHQVYGTIRRVNGSEITIEAREQRMVQVDAAPAIQSYRTIILSVGRAVNVLGSYDAKGVLHAQSIQRAKSSSAGWPADR